MKQSGIVESTQGADAKVRIQRMSSCGGDCNSCGGCENKAIVVKVKNHAGAKAGDTVELEMPSDTVISAAFLAYMAPVLALIAGYVLGTLFFRHELERIAVGLAFMAADIFVTSVYSRRKSGKYEPYIVKISDKSNNAAI